MLLIQMIGQFQCYFWNKQKMKINQQNKKCGLYPNDSKIDYLILSKCLTISIFFHVQEKMYSRP